MKYLSLLLLAGTTTMAIPAKAQSDKRYNTPNWHLQDAKADSVAGTSVTKAYTVLLKGKKANRVVVAVIDGGLDTAHEDLQGHVWTNPKEIPGNNKDDDHNGFIDDIHGWNFLGGRDGRYIEEENKEEEREYYKLKKVYPPLVDTGKFTQAQKKQYSYFRNIQQQLLADSVKNARDVAEVAPEFVLFDSVHLIWRPILKKDTLSVADMQAATAPNAIADSLRSNITQLYKTFRVPLAITINVVEANERAYYKRALKSLERLQRDPNAQRKNIIGDDAETMQETHYGNNDVTHDSSGHGTHVAGIIAATRHNNIGMDGITGNVHIMAIRAVPDGDERDKDIALAIRYAVDNGARIINMSFGKLYSPQKKWVDEAVDYAYSHDVLIVHAAGNNGKSLDSMKFYPSPESATTGKKAPNYITVGASTAGPDSMLAATFSNYSHTQVDVFAPGRAIYSTMPGNTYMFRNGTSMAAPVVTGIAALLLEYYPNLSARQLKVILEKTAIPYPAQMVYIPGTKTKQPFSSLSATGGIVNACKALEMAANMKGEHSVKK